MLAPVYAAQSQAPRTHSVTNFSQSRSYLGIGVLDVSDERAKALGLKEPQGVEVTVVREDSPAAKAGIQRGDVILEFNGEHVEGGEQFVRLVQETPVGRKVNLKVWRNRTAQTLTTAIGSNPGGFMISPDETLMQGFPPMRVIIPDMPHDTMSWRNTAIGIETESLNSQLADFFGVKDGVLVRMVVKGSAADKAGLKAGDVITKVGGQTISSPANLGAYIRKAGSLVTLTVVRNRKEITLDVKVAQNLMRWDAFPLPVPPVRQTL